MARFLRFLCLLVAGACLGRCGWASPPRVLFVIGEQEYNTRETLPRFAKKELVPLGYACRFVHAASDDRSATACHIFPGLVAALDEADLLVLSTRRRFLKSAELERLKQWIGSGKPVVAIRTSSHAFAARDRKAVPKGHLTWQRFDQEVLGARYRGHYGNKKSEGKPGTLLWVDDKAQGHPLLEGVAWEGRRTVTSHLYKMHDLSASAGVLLRGRVQGQEPIEPVAWTHRRNPGRTFYTSLGSEEDLRQPAVRRLLVNAVRWSLEDDPR